MFVAYWNQIAGVWGAGVSLSAIKNSFGTICGRRADSSVNLAPEVPSQAANADLVFVRCGREKRMGGKGRGRAKRLRAGDRVQQKRIPFFTFEAGMFMKTKERMTQCPNKYSHLGVSFRHLR